MGRIEFLTRDKLTRAHLDAADRGRTLLAVARDHGVPVLFTCEAGACAACLVRIEHASTGNAALPALTPEERLAFDVLGLPTDDADAQVPESLEGRGLEPPAWRPVYRLACQLRVGDADLRVIVADDVGSMAAIATSPPTEAGASATIAEPAV